MYTGDFRAFHDPDGDVAILDTVTFTAFLIDGDFTRIYMGGLNESIRVKETIPQIFAILQMDGNTQLNNVLNENAVTPEPIMKVENPKPKKSRWVKWAESLEIGEIRQTICCICRNYEGCDLCPLKNRSDFGCQEADSTLKYLMEEVEDDN